MRLRHLAVAVCGVLSFSASTSASPISVAYLDTVTSWEWAQLADTPTSLTWNALAGMCPQNGVAACGGTLDGKEFDGWIWATQEQIENLWINGTDLNAVPSHLVTQVNSTFAPQFLALFTSTLLPVQNNVVMGWSASTDPVNSANGIQPNIVDNALGVIDLANASANALKTSVGINPGRAWLHRPVAAVPEPSSLFLLGTGFALAARRLRRPR